MKKSKVNKKIEILINLLSFIEVCRENNLIPLNVFALYDVKKGEWGYVPDDIDRYHHYGSPLDGGTWSKCEISAYKILEAMQ